MMTARNTTDAEAYQLYLQGRYQWNKRTLDGLQQSLDLFQQAIQHDPRYALAYAGQADAYALLADSNVLPAREVLPKLKAAANKALELDDSLAEAHTSLAWAEFHDWDWIGAEKEFKRAIELNSSYASAHSWYGEYLMVLGRFDPALSELNRAYELSPLEHGHQSGVGLSFLLRAPVPAGHRPVTEDAGHGCAVRSRTRVSGAGVRTEWIARRGAGRIPEGAGSIGRRHQRTSGAGALPMPRSTRKLRPARFWTSSRNVRSRPTCSRRPSR